MIYKLSETREAQAAASIQNHFNAKVAEIRADSQLTEEGKRAQLSEWYNHSKTEIDKLKKVAHSDRDRKNQELRRELFGVFGTADPQRAISYRDAQDRVSKLELGDQSKALALLEEAELSGDEIMTKALIKRAIEMRWDKVANAYIEKNPHTGKLYEALWNSSTKMSNASLQNAAAFFLQKPTEIGW